MHHLDLAWAKFRNRAHTVLVFDSPIQDIGQDLHILVTMAAEAVARCYAILVNYSQSTKPHVIPVLIIAEGKRVATIQRSPVRVPPVPGPPDFHHALVRHRFPLLSVTPAT